MSTAVAQILRDVQYEHIIPTRATRKERQLGRPSADGSLLGVIRVESLGGGGGPAFLLLFSTSFLDQLFKV